ncbi:MAG: penicillin-binding transpeptidase domain-containing protein [Polyangiaceae bacterium]
MLNLDPKRARWIRLRMGILCGAMGVALGGFISSAYRVQVEDGQTWKETAERQRQRRLHVEPKRGTVYDRNGAALAVSVEVPSVSADVVEMLRGIDGADTQNAVLRDASLRLAAALSLPQPDVYDKLANKRRFVWLKRRISGDETAMIRDLGDPKKSPRPINGLNIEGEGHRYYPARELAGAVLGFVAPDGVGKDGLELALDDELRGHVEEISGLRDRAGHLLFSQGNTQADSLSGHDVTLTLDEGIQHIAESELSAAQGTYETKGAALVVMDPQTGEILALASTPGYNPNDYGVSDVEARRDRAVTDRFEPGSVMKVFTIAGALAAGTLSPTETIFCEHGSFKVGPVTIHDTHLNDWLTPTQILAKSSNIGALKIGLKLGEAGLYATFRKFGFGEPTGLPLPGEASGVLRPRGRPWVDVETANASFGQGVSVTAVQLATGFAAIANGGKLLEPELVKKVTDSRGEIVRENTTHVRREAVPPAVAHLVAEMLVAVTEEGGTAVEAAVPGFRVAGKTATAQKVDPGTGRYSSDKYTSSFVGFVPAEHPRLVVAVVLDEPMIGHYGGDLAGPVFRRVAEQSLRYLGVTPSTPAAKLAKVTRADDPADVTIAAIANPNQTPPNESIVPVQNLVPLGPDAVRIPDLTGLGARAAANTLMGLGLVPQIEGSGRVGKQSPAAGSAAAKGSSVRLVFEPAS